MINLMFGDCLERMKEIPDGSVDLILADPPYGTTKCKWDVVIDLELMWSQLKRITKRNGAIVLTASQPFSSVVVCSNLKDFKYQWVWNKSKAANFPLVKSQPLKVHEDVLVFCSNKDTYKPQMVKGVLRQKGGYNVDREFAVSAGCPSKVNDEYYPKSILDFSVAGNKDCTLHPTQKPVALMEYLISTYTNEGETVLDFTMGSGTTGVACVNLNRSFIGVEMDENYFNIATKRIVSAQETVNEAKEKANEKQE